MRYAKILAVLLVVQIGCAFFLVHRLRQVSNSVGQMIEQGGVPIVYEVGSSKGDLIAIVGRSRLTPDYLEGFFAAGGQGDVHIQTTFLRDRGVWQLRTEFNGRLFEAEGIALSSTCFELLEDIHDSRGIGADDHQTSNDGSSSGGKQRPVGGEPASSGSAVSPD